MKESKENKVKTLEERKKEYIEYFKTLHDNYSNEIPEEMIDGLDPKNHEYKVRGNWFTAIYNKFQNCESFGLFSEEFNEEWKSFFSKYGERMWSDGGRPVRTTKEEIEKADSLLIKAQEIISKSL